MQEQKRLELEEMNKVLAELGIEQPSNQQQEPAEPSEEAGLFLAPQPSFPPPEKHVQ